MADRAGGSSGSDRGARRAGSDFDRLGDLLPGEAGGCPRNGGARGAPPAAAGQAAGSAGTDGDRGRRVTLVWADEVGSEIAANARPVQLRGGRLVVTTSSSAWAHTLQNMAPMVVERLNQRLGEGTVEKAVFRHAGWDPAWNATDSPPGGGAAQASSAHPATDANRPGRKVAAATTPAAARDAEPKPLAAEAPAGPGYPPHLPAGAGISAKPPAASEPDDLSAEERRALEDVDALPLPSAIRQSIRQAMIADFVRSRQDSGRC